jgi:hypothetical protein
MSIMTGCRAAGAYFGDIGDGLAQQGFELIQHRVRAVVATQPCRTFELLDHRVERAVHMIGGAEIAQPRVRRGVQSLKERSDQPRLANAWFARQQNRLAVSSLSQLPALH